MNRSRPSLLLSVVVVVLLAVGWGLVRLFFFREAMMQITFVLPLLVCVWTRRRWQIWFLAAAFIAMATWKVFALMDADAPFEQRVIYLGATLFNILVGAVVVQAILSMREGLERQNATISEQNAELEAQAEELTQQNEEIKVQAEELAEQNEEIESQSEEVARQNEELLELTARLEGREQILHGLLLSSRAATPVPRMLEDLCRRALTVLGAPADRIAVLELQGDGLQCLACAGSEALPAVPDAWPVDGSIAGVVLEEKRTAYVSDLVERPDLSRPFDDGAAVRSVLATPVALSDDSRGLLVACSAEAAHWTEEQFRVLEWIAGQCGLMMEILHGHQELAAHAEALEAANRSKDRFLAMLSHELRTPLTPVLAAAGALEGDPTVPENVRLDLRMIRRNIGIQSRLIDDLLDITRIGRGKVELDRRMVRICDLLKDVAGIVGGELDAKSQGLRMELDGLDGCAVEGDSSRLQQVFWNLLKNAIKFSAPGSAIELRGRAEDGRVVVEIADQGPGIDAADMGRIFLPFEQTLDAPRWTSEGGLGLGLAIAKSIVELHAGGISVRSDGHGKGAVFVVELPTADGEFPPGGGEDIEPSPDKTANGGPLRILLVEDHVDTRTIIARLLQGFGYFVEDVGTATAAFERFRDGGFDLVISDLGLPDESGLDLMRRMRTLRPDVRGICLSGYGTDGDVKACHEAGFLEHITKPVDILRLRVAIDRVMEAKHPAMES